MKTVNIKGKARYIGLEGGFWGIEGDDGSKYTPINMPEQLKSEGANVRVRAHILHGAVSLSMWGDAIRIVSFETIGLV